MIGYLINALMWSLAGFVAGVIVADIANNRQRDIVANRRLATQRAIGGALVVASVLGVTAVAVQTNRLGDAIECQAIHNARLTEANRLDREGQKLLLETVLNPQATREQRRGALTRYVEYLSQADQKRGIRPEGGC